MPCPFCPPGKLSCKHRGPSSSDRAQTAPTPVLGRKEIVVPGTSSEAPKPGDSLFVLHGKLRDLACVLCGAIIGSGQGQPRERYIHGLDHVRLGQAREIAVSAAPFAGSTFVARFEVMTA